MYAFSSLQLPLQLYDWCASKPVGMAVQEDPALSAVPTQTGYDSTVGFELCQVAAMEDLMREKMAVDAEVARLSAALAEAGAAQAQVTDLRSQARLPSSLTIQTNVAFSQVDHFRAGAATELVMSAICCLLTGVQRSWSVQAIYIKETVLSQGSFSAAAT